MFYVFVCPGMPFNGETIPSGKSLGGSETACYYTARAIAARGHRVTVFTNDPQASGRHDGVDYAYAGPASERSPLGRNVQGFIENAECDVLVMQRATGVFRTSHAAKVAFLWLHDLALQRQLPTFRADAFQYDGVLAVSEWHAKQVRQVWEVNPDSIYVLPNAVDRTLYAEPPGRVDGGLRLLYQSRYERGIDHLITPGGVMDQLAKLRPDAKLYVCGYENEPEHMRYYYGNVRSRIAQMPNVEIVGHMGKAQLAKFQQGCHAMLYPGTFEETSCISAMEAQCAGLPFIGNACGALPETCKDSGSKLFDLLPDGSPDIAEFVKYLANVPMAALQGLSERQLEAAQRIDWANSAEFLDNYAESVLASKANPFSIVRTALDRSDVKFAEFVLLAAGPDEMAKEREELALHYQFATSREALALHYDQDHALEALEKDQNLDVTENSRFRFVFEELERGKPSSVLDYGCQKGHYIFSAIKAGLNSGVRYTGMDVSQKTVDWANAEFQRLGLGNSVHFECQDALAWSDAHSSTPHYDALLLCEVLEHVVDPVELCDKLEHVLIDGARVVISTPYGPWEGKDYNSNPDAKRYHLHHFELNDLHDMFDHHEGFSVVGVPAGDTPQGRLGSYVVSFNYRRENGPLARPVDYNRKLREFAPRQTVSACMIVKDAERTLLRTLHSIKDVADEFIIAIDRDSTDRTEEIVRQFRDQHCRNKRVEVIYNSDSPLHIGFDAARNRTLDQGRGDWVLWIDADEELIHPERVFRFLRNNMYDGYGIAQHHMSADPPGVLTTDWPVRLFRRVPYLRFLGVVHEHPDDIQRPNSGPRCAAQIMPNDFCIVHHGYTTEEVRRQRFHRNFPLIRRDRKQNPDRVLGRMLWMRDLAHLCMFELERTGGNVTPAVVDYARQGVAEWEEMLIASDRPINARMVRDGLEFYSTLVSVLGGFEVSFQLHAAREFGHSKLEAGPRFSGKFLNRSHYDAFMKVVSDEQLRGFDSKYF